MRAQHCSVFFSSSNKIIVSMCVQFSVFVCSHIFSVLIWLCVYRAPLLCGVFVVGVSFFSRVFLLSSAVVVVRLVIDPSPCFCLFGSLFISVFSQRLISWSSLFSMCLYICTWPACVCVSVYSLCLFLCLKSFLCSALLTLL